MTRTVACQLTMPNVAHLFDQIASNVRYAKRMARVGTKVGRSVAICGAGPTLAETRHAIGDVDEVWACNSALPYLMRMGHRVTDGFCIDQGREMLRPDEWGRTYGVHYYLGSAVHPELVRKLRREHRAFTFFHSYQGIPNPPDWSDPHETCEMSLYRRFPDSVQVGHGLNSVPRAVCLAVALGFSRIDVYGADCAFRPDGPPMPPLDAPEYADWLRQLVMYADGRSPIVYGANAVMCEAVIDGRRWHTRPDMVISARHLLDLARQYPAVNLIGDTLPNVFAAQPPEFFDDLPSLSVNELGKMTGFGSAVAA